MRFFLLRKQTLTILAVCWIALLLLLGSYRRTTGSEMVKLRGKEATIAKTEATTAITTTRQHTANTTTSEAVEEDREGRCELDKLLVTSCSPTYQTTFTQRNFTRLPESFLKTSLPPTPLPACPRLHPWRVWREIAAWNRTRDPSKTTTTMLFVVKSAARNFARRRTLRRTWGSVEGVRDARFATVFVVGRPTYESQQEHLEREASAEGDLLQCDMRDTYRGLPDKVLAAFGWLSGRRPPVDYVTVTDDDCMMRLERVQRAFHPSLTSRDDDDVIRCGFDYHRDATPIRDRKSKWYISRRVYPSAWYPTFCHGGMWTVTMSMVEKLWCAAQTTDRGGFYLEDVYITGILRTKVSARCGGDDADDDDVRSITNMERAGMVRHLSARSNVYAIFARYWHLANLTLPWNETDDAVRTRAPRGTDQHRVD